ALVAITGPSGKPFSDHARGELVELGAPRLDLPLDADTRLGESETANAGVDVVGRFVQRGEWQVIGQADDAVLDIAILGAEHSKGPALPNIDKLDLLELLALLLDQHDAGATREARQQLARLAEQLLECAAPTAADDPAFDLAALLVTDVADF